MHWTPNGASTSASGRARRRGRDLRFAIDTAQDVIDIENEILRIEGIGREPERTGLLAADGIAAGVPR